MLLIAMKPIVPALKIGSVAPLAKAREDANAAVQGFYAACITGARSGRAG